MMHVKLFIFLLLPIYCFSNDSALYIKNVKIIDTKAKVIFDGSVLIKDSKIEEVFETSDLSSQLNIKTLDGKGKYLIPGFQDLHTHNWSGNMPPFKAFKPGYHDFTSQEGIGHDYLYAGVTTYLDLYSPSDVGDEPENSKQDLNIFELREKAQSLTITSPNIFAAGPIFGLPGTHGVFNWGAVDAVCFEFPNTPETERRCKTKNPIAKSPRELSQLFKESVLNAIQKRKPDVIKIVFDNPEDNPVGRDRTMPLYVAKTIIDTAKSKNLKVVAHVGTWSGVESLANLGLGAFTHLPHGKAPDSTIKALKDNNVFAIPTLSVAMESGALLDTNGPENFVNYPLHQKLTPDFFMDTFLVGVENYSESKSRPWKHKHNKSGSQYKAVKSLYDGGVKVITGTDAGNEAVVFGASLHRELERTNKAGVDTWSILQAATANADEFLNHKRGLIKKGYFADLILLNKNPVENIKNTTSVDTVILNGRVLDREKLQTK